MQFRILGPLEIIADDGTPLSLGSPTQRTLLLLLLVHAGETVSTDRMIDVVWGDDPPDDPLNSLRFHIWKIRTTLEPDRPRGAPSAVLVADGPGYRLAAGDVDATRFERAAAAGRDLVAADPAAAEGTLREARELWRGDPLADAGYADFAQPEIRRLHEVRAGLHESLVDAVMAQGRHDDVIPELQALVAEYPTREGIRGRLMVALYRAGRQAEALQAYQDARRVLGEELGIEPTPELRALEERLLLQDESLAPARPPHAPAAARLPVPLTSFVGREEELAVLARRVESHRLVTLLGPGGVGKTRLAVETARRLDDRFEDGVVFLDLAPLRDPGLLVEAVAAALGLGGEERGDSPRPSLAAPQRLAAALRNRNMLLVVDNCEHLVQPIATLLAGILPAEPVVRVLATSRIRLGVPGEAIVEVDPLPVLAGEDGGDAVRLFAERAGPLRPGFVLDEATLPVVVDICRRLDGMPLAIELAAARCRTLNPREIAANLHDRFRLLGTSRGGVPERQQTLEATIDWSHDLLTPAERTVFRRLAVFAGGATLEAAQAVCCGDDVAPIAVPGIVADLADHSMILARRDQGPDTRLDLLETFREYGVARMHAAGEENEVRARHARHHLALAEAAWAAHRGPDREAWLFRLDRERANLDVALDHLQHREPEEFARLVGALCWFWFVTGQFGEGRSRVAAVLESGAGDDETRARVLLHASLFAARANPTSGWDPGEEFEGVTWARPRAEERRPEVLWARDSLDLYRRAGDPLGTADALYALAIATASMGTRAAPQEPGFADRHRMLLEALDLYREGGDRWGEAETLLRIGETEFWFASIEDPWHWFRDAQAVYEELGSRRGMAMTMASEADARQVGGDPVTGMELATTALAILEELGAELAAAWASFSLAGVLRRGERWEEAIEVYRRTGPTLESYGDMFLAIIVAGELALCYRGLGRPADAKAALRRGFAQAVEWDSPGQACWLLECLAGILAEEGDRTGAARLFGATEHWRRAVDAPMPEWDRERYEADLALLGDEAHDSTRAAGRSLSLEEAGKKAFAPI